MASDARTAHPSPPHSSAQGGGNGFPVELAHGAGGNGSSGQNGAGNGTARLDSWKEIAAFFDRDIRTVQLWEKKEGLPVYRHEHAGRPTVYSYREELDSWLRTRTHAKAAPAPEPPIADTAAPIPPVVAAVRLEGRSRLLLPLLAVIALSTATITVLSVRHRAHPQPPPLSTGMLAVLPFEDLTPSAGKAPAAGPSDFVVDGLTDDVITDLGRSGQLPVISRLSVMQFHGQSESLPSIAAKLHATTVLEGEVARDKDTVQVTARLVDAVHDRELWAETYRRSDPSVIAWQDEVAAEISTAVAHTLTGATAAASYDARPVDPRVRVATLTGRYLWNQRDEPDMRRAIDEFRKAIALDPGYAPAWAGLADSYNLMAVWGSMRASEAFPQARADAEQALALDPSSAEGWNSLAFEVYRYEWDFGRADADFRKAIAANPNYAVAHQWYGEFLGDLRRFDESIAESRRAQDLDPLSAMVSCDLADAYMHAGRYAEAREVLRHVLSLYPNFQPAHGYLATIDGIAGDNAAAEKETALYAQMTGDVTGVKLMRASEESSGGQLTRARAEVDAYLATTAGAATPPYNKAELYFEVGETEAGYAALEKAFQERTWWMVTLMVDPGFAVVRRQPRFIAMEKRVGLPVRP